MHNGNYNPTINKEEFEKVCEELKTEALTLRHIGRAFGHDFWELIIMTLLKYQNEESK